MKKLFAISAAILLFLASCSQAVPAVTETQANSIQPSKQAAVEMSPTPAPTETPPPTAVAAEATPNATATFVATSTPQPLGIQFVSTTSRHTSSSSFILEFTNPEGSYYAIGSYQGSQSILYQCSFEKNRPGYLDCSGGGVPAGTPVYIDLFDLSTNKQVYTNVLTFTGIIPTPTGMVCEIEPQWNGAIPAHQLGGNCFALSCWQNGTFFYGSNDTCTTPWPFSWDFTHPLSTPQN